MNSEDVVKLNINTKNFEEHTKNIIKLILEQWENESTGKYSIDSCMADDLEIMDWSLVRFYSVDSEESLVNVSVGYSEEFEEGTYSDFISFPVSYYDSDWSFIQFKEGQRAKKWLKHREENLLKALKEQVEEMGYKMVKENL